MTNRQPDPLSRDHARNVVSNVQVSLDTEASRMLSMGYSFAAATLAEAVEALGSCPLGEPTMDHAPAVGPGLYAVIEGLVDDWKELAAVQAFAPIDDESQRMVALACSRVAQAVRLLEEKRAAA